MPRNLIGEVLSEAAAADGQSRGGQRGEEQSFGGVARVTVQKGGQQDYLDTIEENKGRLSAEGQANLMVPVLMALMENGGNLSEQMLEFLAQRSQTLRAGELLKNAAGEPVAARVQATARVRSINSLSWGKI
jgi:hypothetical protein